VHQGRARNTRLSIARCVLLKPTLKGYETERQCTCSSPNSSDQADHSPTSKDSDDVTGRKNAQVYFGGSPGCPSFVTEDLLLSHDSTQPYFGGPISHPSNLTEKLHHNPQPRPECPAHHSSLMGDHILVYSCPLCWMVLLLSDQQHRRVQRPPAGSRDVLSHPLRVQGLGMSLEYMLGGDYTGGWNMLEIFQLDITRQSTRSEHHLFKKTGNVSVLRSVLSRYTVCTTPIPDARYCSSSSRRNAMVYPVLQPRLPQ
jgi:hypothetical protein